MANNNAQLQTLFQRWTGVNSAQQYTDRFYHAYCMRRTAFNMAQAQSFKQSLPACDFHFFTIPDAPANPPPLSLSNSSMWTYCGPLLPLNDTNASLPPTFHAWSSRTLSSSLLPVLLPFLRATHDFLQQHGMQHYWLTVRASKPTSEFDTPRWHTDDHFFDPAESDGAKGLWKLCSTLQGPGTMFAADGTRARKALRRVKERARKTQQPHVCPVVRCAACGRTSEEVREGMAIELKGEAVVQPGRGEMAFFKVGGKEGAVHSEPRIDCDRVFVNVVPGTEDELRRLMGRWGMEFPRSWSFGVPMVLDLRGQDENGADHGLVE